MDSYVIKLHGSLQSDDLVAKGSDPVDALQRALPRVARMLEDGKPTQMSRLDLGRPLSLEVYRYAGFLRRTPEEDRDPKIVLEGEALKNALAEGRAIQAEVSRQRIEAADAVAQAALAAHARRGALIEWPPPAGAPVQDASASDALEL